MSAPALRFKEFDGDWPSVPLKDFVSFRKGKGISKADIQEDGTFQCIRYGELYTTYGQVITTIKSRTNISPSESILSQNGDVIIPASGETQIDIATASCVAKENVILGGDLNILSHQESGEWLAYYLSSAKKLEIAQLAQGNSVVHLYSSQLKELKVNKPTKAEQTKIASFLSAVDEKITQLTQKYQLLSQYKQGMMQKLFSQQIRFKADDGSEFGEWGITSIKDAVSFIKDGTHGTHQDDPSSNLFLLSAKNLQNGKIVIDEKDRKINQKEFDSIYKNYNLKDGDILLSVVGTIGRVAIFKDYYESYAFQRSVAFMRFKKALPEFIYQLFLAKDFQNELLVRQVVSAQPGIYLGDLSKIEIKLPCLAEQTKIANFLSAIDQKIEVVAQQIKQAKQWKKGLLQQMFV
ncbi:type I restriction modification DNA specificity domain protein [Acinetobacter baumannii 348935]|nr:type I restriction modification DNA specificity domain protein [Acinetobacter baumannii 348935]